MQAIWPATDAPIHDFQVALSDTDGISIDIHYSAAQDLGDVPINMVQQNLQTTLEMPNLKVTAERWEEADSSAPSAPSAKSPKAKK